MSAPARPRAAPGPTGRRLLGSLLEVRRDRIGFVERALADYGDLVQFSMGPRRLFLVSRPDLFRHVLVDNLDNYRKGLGLAEAKALLGDGLLTGGGEASAGLRPTLQPAMRPQRMAEFGVDMVRAAEAMLERWRQRGAAECLVDREMARLTLDVLGSTLLGFDLEARAEPIRRDLTRVTDWAMRRMTGLVRWPGFLPTPGDQRARRALRRLEGLAGEILAAAAPEAGAERLVDLLAAASRGEPRQARDQVLTFLLAGHETTALALTWVWNALAAHPEVERRLHAELDEVLGERPATVEDLPRLSFTRAVVDETLRLDPPVWLLPRESLAADELGGVAIPARSQVLLCVYTLHRHPGHWPRPGRFEPERFLGRERPAAAYLPFGAGPRSCIASRFGLQEVLLAVATVARRYRLRRLPGHEKEVERLGGLTLHPRQPLAMALVER